MKPKKIKLPETREAWLKQRKTGIGGSDAGIILGVNKYKSAYTLWAEKSGLVDPEDVQTEATWLGNQLEEIVAKRFEEETGKKVQRSSFSYKSAERPWMLANIDRKVVGENAGLECKSANLFTEQDYRADVIPPSYYAQILHYMAVMDFDRMYLAVAVLQRGFFIYTIEREDPAVQADMEALIEAEAAFWENVQTGAAPEMDGSASTSDTLNRMDKKGGDLTFLDELIDQRDQLKAEADAIDKQIGQIENKIKEEMNDHGYDFGVSSQYSVRWKEQEKTTIDTKKLKAEYPEIAEKCSRVSTSRPLMFRRKKSK